LAYLTGDAPLEIEVAGRNGRRLRSLEVQAEGRGFETPSSGGQAQRRYERLSA
jgi:hypothetical protein